LRHHRFHDTAHNLEPNVKQGPGGLRDIQTIAWVAKRHFGAESLAELAAHGFLAARELAQLESAQAWLWRIRFALHLASGRREDRLLFDHQIRLARMFGYEDATYTLAVEQFMQRSSSSARRSWRIAARRRCRSPRISRSATSASRRCRTRFSRATRPRCSSCSSCCSRTRA
jgi:UTP:GlnB (protein PII) uridylyltransferase